MRARSGEVRVLHAVVPHREAVQTKLLDRRQLLGHVDRHALLVLQPVEKLLRVQLRQLGLVESHLQAVALVLSHVPGRVQE